MPSAIGGSYTHANANGASTINAQILVGVQINTKGAAANILTLQDGTSGPTIAVIDTTIGPVWLHYGAQLKNGAVVATLSAGTAADVTIITN